MLAGILLCVMTGGRNKQPQAPAESSNTSADLSGGNNESGFDIEHVRKDIVIKGQTIEIPVKLKDIPRGRINSHSISVKFYDNDIIK